MLYRKLARTAAILLLGTMNVAAATLVPETGTVHVNNGTGFTNVQHDTVLSSNAKVMVSPGGSARLVYSSDCSVVLASGVWTVQEQPPCKQGVAVLDFTTRMNQEAPPAGTAPATEPGIGTTTLVVGGLVVAGGVAAAIALSQDGNDDQASP